MARVLATTAHDDIDIGWEGVAWVVFNEPHAVAIPLKSSLEREGIAPVAIDVHGVGVELEDGDSVVFHTAFTSV